jgi:hypothetical protein
MNYKSTFVEVNKYDKKFPVFLRSAEGGIRTHEPLQDRLLKPTPLTWLGDLCAETPFAVIENTSY